MTTTWSSDQNIFVLLGNKIFVSVIRYSNETKLPLYTNINTGDNLQIIHAPYSWQIGEHNPLTQRRSELIENISHSKINCVLTFEKYLQQFRRRRPAGVLCVCCSLTSQGWYGGYLWDLWLMLLVYYTDAAAVLFGAFSYFSESDTTTAACPRPCFTIYYSSDSPTTVTLLVEILCCYHLILKKSQQDMKWHEWLSDTGGRGENSG